MRLCAFGLDTQLSGALRLTTTLEQQPTVEGTLRSRDGSFAAYRRELEIKHGLLIFAGTADNSNVDVRAIRLLRYEGADKK
jgi:translocation and assembly module TamB